MRSLIRGIQRRFLAFGVVNPARQPIGRVEDGADNGRRMGRPTNSLRVRLSRPDLAGQLANALTAGDCLCARIDAETMLVVHRAAADEAEARLELGFFLRAWEGLHRGVRVELV